MLGIYNDGITQTMVSVIGGIPMGIGIFAVWPLAKRFGKRNVTLVGFILYAIGGVICCLAPANMVVVLVGQFIKNIGGLPCAYVFMALFADTLDHVEWKSGIRCDGTAMSVYNIIAVAMVGICTGIFNGLLAGAGYIAPSIDAAGDTVAAVQPDGVQSIITFAFVGLEIITGIVLAVLLVFLSVEKTVEYSRLNNMTIQAWSPFQSPSWSGCFLGDDRYEKLNQELEELAAQYRVSSTTIAAAWILRHPAAMQLITGIAKESRLIEIIHAGNIQLTRQEWYKLYLAAGHILP